MTTENIHSVNPPPNADSVRLIVAVFHNHVISYSATGMRCSACGDIGGIEVPDGASYVHLAEVIAAQNDRSGAS